MKRIYVCQNDEVVAGRLPVEFEEEDRMEASEVYRQAIADHLEQWACDTNQELEDWVQEAEDVDIEIAREDSAAEARYEVTYRPAFADWNGGRMSKMPYGEAGLVVWDFEDEGVPAAVEEAMRMGLEALRQMKVACDGIIPAPDFGDLKL